MLDVRQKSLKILNANNFLWLLALNKSVSARKETMNYGANDGARTRDN